MRPDPYFYPFRKLKRLQLMVAINQCAGAHLASLFVPVRFFWNESASKRWHKGRYSTNSLWFIEQNLLGMLGSPRRRLRRFLAMTRFFLFLIPNRPVPDTYYS